MHAKLIDNRPGYKTRKPGPSALSTDEYMICQNERLCRTQRRAGSSGACSKARGRLLVTHGSADSQKEPTRFRGSAA